MTKFLDRNGVVQLVSGLKDYIETRFDNVFKRRILEANNPVGTVREFSVPTDPATLLGIGTWVQIAQGRALVGVSSGDPDFNYAGRMGGSKTFKLTPENIGYKDYGIVSADGSFSRVHDHKNTYTDITHLPPYYCVYAWRRIS